MGKKEALVIDIRTSDEYPIYVYLHAPHVSYRLQQPVNVLRPKALMNFLPAVYSVGLQLLTPDCILKIATKKEIKDQYFAG